MSENIRPTLDPEPTSSGADFTATATAPQGAWDRLTENLARIEAGFAARDAAAKEGSR